MQKLEFNELKQVSGGLFTGTFFKCISSGVAGACGSAIVTSSQGHYQFKDTLAILAGGVSGSITMVATRQPAFSAFITGATVSLVRGYER